MSFARRTLASLSIAGGLLFGTSGALADEPDPSVRFQDDRHPPEGTGTNLFLSGALVTGLFYGPALASSYIWEDSHGAANLRVPVIGPWMKLGKTKLCSADPTALDCNDFMRVFGAVLLVVDGIGQAGGIGMMVESLFMRTEPTATESASYVPRYVPPTYFKERAHPFTFEAGSVEMTAAPVAGDSSEIGLSLFGSF